MEVPAPTFPELEVLRTVHRVAFDPDVRIRGVEGDFGGAHADPRADRRPWLAGLFRRDGAVLQARIRSSR